ncbi:hypothetical protein CAPTEDRAFT_204251 [Capitella teleta]|uniref:Apple domain-containing protein n=1 Tax=Capitella teleta TaxID=283909 RepID=R7VLJ5_CAPTE|nr:hypothetical protein CAPTEDRAFT_204251 [Capitella teleta]|eukprot:ELU17660.1 hypothetical protein CAPTEDRAFT_204251 [Capitella teleta]
MAISLVVFCSLMACVLSLRENYYIIGPHGSSEVTKIFEEQVKSNQECALHCELHEKCVAFNIFDDKGLLRCVLYPMAGLGQGWLTGDADYAYRVAADPYTPMGCYGHNPNILNMRIDFRPMLQGSWNQETYLKIVVRCNQVARSESAAFFGIEFYGECYTGFDAGIEYWSQGPSDSCMFGLGEENTIFVYRVDG